jgi:hypothetical protein
LTWVEDSDPNLAGYEILWRETIAPFWENVIPVGLVNKATVQQSKDNVVFGVSHDIASSIECPSERR